MSGGISAMEINYGPGRKKKKLLYTVNVNFNQPHLVNQKLENLLEN